MNENEFLAHIRRQVRARKMAFGGQAPVKKMWWGGDAWDAVSGAVGSAYGAGVGAMSGDPITGAIGAGLGYLTGNGISDGSVGKLATDVYDEFGKYLDPLGVFDESDPVQNEYQATTPNVQGQDWGSGMADARTQLGAADQNAQGIQGAQTGLIGQMGTQAGRLQDRAEGRGPSIADMQMKQGMQQNQANAASMAASMRGVNPALAARMAGQQANQANTQMAQQAMLGRLAEQQQAEGQLAGVRAQQAGVMGQQAQAAGNRMGAWGNMYSTNAAGAGAKYGTDVNADLDVQRMNAQTSEGNTQRASDSGGIVDKIIGHALGGRVRKRFDEGGEAFYTPPSPAVSEPAPFYEPESNAVTPMIDWTGELDSARWSPDPSFGNEQSSELSAKYDDLMKSVQALPAQGDQSTQQAAQNSGKKGLMDSGLMPILLKMILGIVNNRTRGRGKITPRNRAMGGEMSPAADVSDGVPKYFWGALATIGSQVLGQAMKEDPQKDPSQMYGGYDGGGSVPGQAKVSGDSERNDTVPALLSAGEVVLPRSVTMGENAPDRAAGFLKGLQAAKEQERQDAEILSQRVSNEDLEMLKRQIYGGRGPTGEPKVWPNGDVTVDDELTGRRTDKRSIMRPSTDAVQDLLNRTAMAMASGNKSRAIDLNKKYLAANEELLRSLAKYETDPVDPIEFDTTHYSGDASNLYPRRVSEDDAREMAAIQYASRSRGRMAKGGIVGKPDYAKLMRRQKMLAQKIAELGSALDGKNKSKG